VRNLLHHTPNRRRIFPLDNPTIITLPAALFIAWLVSILDHSPSVAAERARFDDQYVRSQTGLGAEGSVSH